jgi:hypothetical protein
MTNRVSTAMGRGLARYLEKQTGNYVPFAVTPAERLRRTLRPGDVLLVEGNTRISAAIKYLTHSTWSHAAFCVSRDGEGLELVEADLSAGVHSVPIETYQTLNTRICRPVSLTPEDLERIVAYMKNAIGRTYDLKNVVDLARFLLPRPPVPHRWRRRMLALGSGDPTRAICSTLIAEAFQQVRYPILPEIMPGCPRNCAAEILTIRHHSLFVPRDFDLSPYFRIVKPTIENGFDYSALTWDDATGHGTAGAGATGTTGDLPDCPEPGCPESGCQENPAEKP